MTSHTTTMSVGATALGGLFAIGTVAVLFWDIRSLGDITTDHLMTALVLVGTIASGHMFWSQASQWRLLPSIGLAALFCAGTMYCVIQSAARNVEATIPKLLETLNSNEQRKKLEDDILEAKGDLRKATAAAQAECVSGVGLRCQGANKARDQADSHYWMLVGRLANMKPQQIENPGQKHAAKVFAALPFVKMDASEIERGLVLFTPFAKALFLEIATIVFLGIGLGRRPVVQFLPLHSGFTFRKAGNRVEFPRRERTTDEQLVLNALLRAGRALSNEELAREMGTSPAEASKRRQVCEASGVVKTEKSGKYLLISPATAH